MVLTLEEIEILKKLEGEEKEFYLKIDNLSFLQRLKEGEVLKRVVPVPFLPLLLGGDWEIGGAVGRIRDGVDGLIRERIPYIYEMIYNWTIPSSVGHNFAFFFFTRNWEERKTMEEIDGFECFNLYHLANYSFPLRISLSREEREMIEEIVNAEDLLLTLRDFLSDKRRLAKLERILRGRDDNIGCLSLRPVIDWSRLETFLHCHFLLSTPSGLVQRERDLENLSALFREYEKLRKEGEILGVVLYKESLVVNDWAKKILSLL